MKIKSDSVNINIEQFNSFRRERSTIIFLHGFTGSLEDWREISGLLDRRFNYVGIDLVGHGKSDLPVETERYNTSSVIKYIDTVLITFSLSEVIIIGYSMGGRAALNFAVNHPEKVKGLIIESTTAGIENENERKDRIKCDEQLAEFIESHDIEDFVELWMNKDIFNTQRRFSNEKLKEIKKRKLSNSKTGLANSLKGFGTGRMDALGNKLNLIQCPVLLISGRLDTKFTKTSSELLTKFPHAEHAIIQNAGHNTHLEETKRFVTVVNEFLRKH
jgi:2-succinyl-6-hydroxy-2,4-cyclohexadiene-1-carboxylate synthase